MARDCPHCGSEQVISEAGDWDFYMGEYNCLPEHHKPSDPPNPKGSGLCCYYCHMMQCVHDDCTWCDGEGPNKAKKEQS